MTTGKAAGAGTGGSDGQDGWPARQPRPRREDVRRRLLAAAVAVFAEAGYDAASIDQVAGAAGFTKGAVYSNFASKDELFFALMEQQITARVQDARELLAGGGTPADVGRQLTETIGTQRQWQLLFLDYWRRAVRDERVREQFLRHRRALRSSIAEAVRQVLPHDALEGFSVEDLVTLLLALSNGLAIEQMTDPEAVPADLLGRVLAALPPRPGG